MHKAHLHRHCIEQLEERIRNLEEAIQEAREAASEESKSSAGDKFETSREMIKLEIDKNSAQLSTMTKMLQHLNLINPNLKKERVNLGSLVSTNEGIYYFSVGMGKVILDGQPYFALSMAAPIAKALQGHKAGEVIAFMGREIQIKEIS